MVKVARQKRKPSRNRKPKSRVIHLEDLERPKIRMCIYGRSGTGKTRLAATFNELGKVLFGICSSEGVNEALSIRGMKNIDLFEIEQPTDFEDLLGEADGYETVVIDHLTGLCDKMLADVLGITKIPEQKSWGMSTREDYQILGNKVKTYLRELMDMNVNVILNAQERVYKKDDDEDMIMPYVTMDTPPTIANWVFPAVDCVCQMFKRNKRETYTKKVGKKTVTREKRTSVVEYCLRVGPDETYVTKFRVPPGFELPDVIADPTAEKILETIGEGV